MLGIGEASELKGSPEGSPKCQLTQSFSRSTLQSITHTQSSTAAIMASGIHRMGKKKYRRNCASGAAATGENNVSVRLYSLLYHRDLENSKTEMAQCKRRRNRAAQRGGTRKNKKMKKTENGKLAMESENGEKK